MNQRLYRENFMQSLRALTLINALAVALLTGCLHIAKTEDLPVSANDIRFDEIAKNRDSVSGLSRCEHGERVAHCEPR
jgi:hypothetical protein